MGSSLRRAGLAGAVVALGAGGAYAAWRYLARDPGGRALPPEPPLEPRAGGACAAAGEQGKLQSKQILVLGLDGAGKTSVLHSLATNHVKRSTASTEGINAVCINTEEAKMEFLEISYFCSYSSDRPRSSPEWPVSTAALTCEASQRVQELACPKSVHPGFKLDRKVMVMFSQTGKGEPLLLPVSAFSSRLTLDAAARG
ncbi:ADP-ribosylation factor-like protein 9 isoform X2 [Eretmochelys imbricata]